VDGVEGEQMMDGITKACRHNGSKLYRCAGGMNCFKEDTKRINGTERGRGRDLTVYNVLIAMYHSYKLERSTDVKTQIYRSSNE
jgi:hypothetical protein